MVALISMEGSPRQHEGAKLDGLPGAAGGGLQAVLLERRGELLRFIAARGAAGEAEDILHDLFLKIERTVPGPIADPRAYLYRMADNLLLDRRRSASRRAIREQAWSGANSGSLTDRDERPSAEQALIDREHLTVVGEVLSALPERTLAIFRRFRIDGVSQKQIAADLGISVSAVEKHLQRAYHALVAVRQRWDAELAVPERPRRE